MSAAAMEFAPWIAAALALIATGAGAWLLAPSDAAAEERRRARIEAFASPVGGDGEDRPDVADQQALETARSMRAKRGGDRLAGLRRAIRQAGLSWSVGRLALVAVALWAAIALSLRAGGFDLLPAMAVGGVGAPGLVLLLLRMLRAKRRKLMETEFPGAMDIIVRGVKSGLPLNDCLDVVSREVEGPLGKEFEKLVEQQRHGLSTGEAVRRFANRVPLTEANFFAIVIGLQTKTGGRLAESLDNLVGVLRARTQLRAKIKSMSSEAKASGGIIAALPPVVAGLVWVTSPAYIGLLFSEPAGNAVLAGSAIWMLIGVAVMKKMIQFDY